MSRLPIGAKTVLAGLFALGLGGTAAGPAASEPAAPATAGAPRLVVEQEVLDLGEVYRGQPAEATFVLRNAGQDILRILGAKPG